MTLVGFILTYPQSPSTPPARRALDLCLSIFANYGKSFAVANSAATIMRHLCVKLDFLSEQNRISGIKQSPSLEANLETLIGNGQSVAEMKAWNQNFDWGPYDMNMNGGENLFDMALDVDFWGDMDTLWPVAANGGGEIPWLQG
jgi:hypothetical protein